MVQWRLGVTLDWTSHLIQFLTIGVTIEFRMDTLSDGLGFSCLRLYHICIKLDFLGYIFKIVIVSNRKMTLNYEQERMWKEVVMMPAFWVSLKLGVVESDCRQSYLQAGNQTHGLKNKRTGVIGTLRYELSCHTVCRLQFKNTFLCINTFFLTWQLWCVQRKLTNLKDQTVALWELKFRANICLERLGYKTSFYTLLT